VSGVEGQLRDLMETAAGEPPRRITVAAVRRRVIRRRVLECVSGAAAIAVLAVAGVAVASSGPGPHQSTVSPGASPPPYYVQIPADPPLTKLVVRSTATGRVTAQVTSPWPGSYLSPYIAAAGNQTYYVVWAKGALYTRKNITDARIYRFHLTPAGQVSGYTLVRGGNLGAQRVSGIAASAGGSVVAVSVTPGNWSPGYAYDNVEVIDTATGAQALWRNDPTGNGTRLDDIDDLVLARNGSELGFLSTARCTTQAPGCAGGWGEVRVLTSPATGGELSSGQVVFRQSELASQIPAQDQVILAAAQLAPDGTSVDVVLDYMGSYAAGNEMEVLQVPVGRYAGALVLYRENTGHGFGMQSFSTDVTGHYLLLDAGAFPQGQNFWIRDGQRVLLAPADGGEEFDEAW
jgi:hypothetical protein